MEACWTNVNYLFSYHTTKAKKSTDFVWLDTFYFHSNTIFVHTKMSKLNI